MVPLGFGVPEVEREVFVVCDWELGGESVAGLSWEVHVWYAWTRVDLEAVSVEPFARRKLRVGAAELAFCHA